MQIFATSVLKFMKEKSVHKVHQCRIKNPRKKGREAVILWEREGSYFW